MVTQVIQKLVPSITIVLGLIYPAGAAIADEMMLLNAKTGKCLTISGGVSTANNVPNVQFDCDSDPSRRWNLNESGQVNAPGAIYQIKNVLTGKCLTISGGVSTANNVPTVQFDCDSDPSRFWRIVDVTGSGIYQIRNMRTDKCLTISGGVSTANNVPTVQFDCDNDLSRRWTVRVKLAGTFPR
jgi:cytolethal distending toxin subunit A